MNQPKPFALPPGATYLSKMLGGMIGLPVLEYHCDLSPIAQKRAQRSGNRNSKYAMFNPQAQLKRGVQHILASQHEGDLLDCPLFAFAFFWFKAPDSWSEKKKQRAYGLKEPKIYHDTKPDRDNLEKFLNDCCEGSILKNDSRIYGGFIYKDYRQDEGFDLYLHTPKHT
jgi:Holliday junction resolvase RusA-like endonuclease